LCLSFFTSCQESEIETRGGLSFTLPQIIFDIISLFRHSPLLPKIIETAQHSPAASGGSVEEEGLTAAENASVTIDPAQVQPGALCLR
jgi:hypothetical protein